MRQKITTALSQFIPEAAVPYCVALWEQYPFRLRITKRRATKAGDYRYDSRDRSHAISVNNNLNRYAFLITYIHEVAHRVVMEKHGRSVRPHGREWKHTFTHLIQPVLNTTIFPEALLPVLSRHMTNPKASSYTDVTLTQMLRKYDLNNNDTLTLHDLAEGKAFVFNKRIFIKQQTKRTRAICLEVKNGRKYLIPTLAVVIEHKID